MDMRKTTARRPARVRITERGWALGLLGLDKGEAFSGRYHHIVLDGEKTSKAFRPREFMRVAS